MLAWITANLGTILVCALLVFIVAFIIAVLVRDKKNGKSTCGGNCGHCPMGGSCHKH